MSGLFQGRLRTNYFRTGCTAVVAVCRVLKCLQINRDTLCILMVYLSCSASSKKKKLLTPLPCWLQLLTQSQRALSNIHTHLSTLDRNALTQFPKAEVWQLVAASQICFTPHLLWHFLQFNAFYVIAEITQGGPADTQFHRGQLPSVGGTTELQRFE